MNPPPDTPTPSAGIASEKELFNEFLSGNGLNGETLSGQHYQLAALAFAGGLASASRLTPDRPKGGGWNTWATTPIDGENFWYWSPTMVSPTRFQYAEGMENRIWGGSGFWMKDSGEEYRPSAPSAPPDAAAVEAMAKEIAFAYLMPQENETRMRELNRNFLIEQATLILTRHLRAQSDPSPVELEGYITTAPERPTGEGWQHVASHNYGNTWMWARPRRLRAQPVKEEAT